MSVLQGWARSHKEPIREEQTHKDTGAVLHWAEKTVYIDIKCSLWGGKGARAICIMGKLLKNSRILHPENIEPSWICRPNTFKKN